MRSLRDITTKDWIVAAVFILLNVADAAITLHAEHHVPGMYEVNPLMRWCLHQSDLLFITVKMGLSLLLTWASLAIDFGPKINKVLLIGSGMLGAVVTWNIVLYAISTARM